MQGFMCSSSATGRKKLMYSLLPSYHITPENDVITLSPFGSILKLRNVLVRYNKTHDAYNLLVSRNTKIHPAKIVKKRGIQSLHSLISYTENSRT
jgi:hypothetical protein